VRSGRGFGKTRLGAEWVIGRAKHGPFYPIALVGQTKADLRDTMVELGESSIMKVSPPWFMPELQATKRRLVWPNGMIAVMYSGDEPDQLRGPQHGSAWVDELAKFKYPAETMDNLTLGLRVGERPQAVVTTTPRPIPVITRLLEDPGVVHTVGSSFENITNLSPRFIERIREQYEGTRLGRQELYGEILDDVPGALWKRIDLETNRVREHSPLTRVVVAIDPAETVNPDRGSETGIVVAGLGGDRHGYVLDDISLYGTPAEWANEAITAYNRFHADRIIGEANAGGDMIEHTLRSVDSKVAYKKVIASRGKQTRAEPIAALYEQGKVHHVGMFADLEDQLCSWVPGEKSPDRLDALVWALSELMLGAPEYSKPGVARYA